MTPAAAEAGIDLRGAPEAWLADVSGLPLCTRLLLVLEQAGFSRAGLVGEAATRAAAFAKRHPQLSSDLCVLPDMPQDPGPRLVLREPIVLSSATAAALRERVIAAQTAIDAPLALPNTMPGFLLPARTATERQAAARMLRRACMKPVEYDGVVSVYLLRPITLQISRALVHTPITPNAVTVAGFLCGLAALAPLAAGTRSGVVLGIALLFLNLLFDNVDGEIARLKYQHSALGERLDHVTDMILDALLLAPIGLGLTRATGQPVWAWLGWAGSAGRVIYGATVQYYVSKQRHSGYTTGFRFWFNIPRERAARDSTSPPRRTFYRRWIKGRVKYLFRKDVSFAAFFALGLFGLLKIPFLLAVAGGLEYGVLSIVHLVVFRGEVPFRKSHKGEL